MELAGETDISVYMACAILKTFERQNNTCHHSPPNQRSLCFPE